MSTPRFSSACEQERHHDSTEVADGGSEARDRQHDASGENDVPPAARAAREPDDEARPKHDGEHHDRYSLLRWRASSSHFARRRVTFANMAQVRAADSAGNVRY